MTRIRIAGFAVLALSLVSIIASSSAYAAPCEKAGKAEFQLCVNKAVLTSPATQEVQAKANKPFILKGEVLGIKTKIEAKKLKLEKGAKLIGGTPGKKAGTSEETIVFEELKVLEPAGCTGVEVENTPAINEVVKVVKPATLAGKLGTVFVPVEKEGKKVFTTIKYKGCLFNATAKVEGTAAGWDNPEKEEKVEGGLVYPKFGEQITEVEKLGGTKEAVGLKFGGNPAELEGEAGVSLVSKEPWGTF